MSVQGTGINSVAEYYDNLAEDYDTAVRAWGYCLPECVTEALLKHTTLEPEAVILDLGCGNGLCGDALFKRGFGHVVGADISQKSLDVAKTRNCYKSLVRADLLQELPFEANSFDYLICVGVTSYLSMPS
jgi:predicted TPR repeat methyltransferase